MNADEPGSVLRSDWMTGGHQTDWKFNLQRSNRSRDSGLFENKQNLN